MSAINHGPMTCVRCWKDSSASVQELGPFKLVRDPGHWGSDDPAVLVLGMSKGNTQSSAFANGSFDDVAFKGIRHRVLDVLQSVGLLPGEPLVRFEQRFLATEREFAFASVVRCSLTGYDRRKRTHTADSPNVVPAFRPGSDGYAFAKACVDQHIGRLSPRTTVVVLLGNTDSYIKALSQLIGATRGQLIPVNDVAYRAGGALFVHVTHPSKGNGHFGAFVRGEGTAGAKMRLARAALAAPDYPQATMS